LWTSSIAGCVNFLAETIAQVRVSAQPTSIAIVLPLRMSTFAMAWSKLRLALLKQYFKREKTFLTGKNTLSLRKLITFYPNKQI